MNENASNVVVFFTLPRIPNNLSEQAMAMLGAGMSTEHVARHVECSSRAKRNLRIVFQATGSTNDEKEETLCRHMGYSFRLAARVRLYASSHRQDSTYHGLCYTSRGALAGTRNSSMGPLWRIDPTTHRTMSERSYNGATSRSIEIRSTEKAEKAEKASNI